ncbi:MAG: hypothetical protein KAR38_12255 [Calditrichia bacterium]|nr:hypothetical protein [Calditrichia bacterium]
MQIGEFNISGMGISAFATYIGIKEMDVLLDVGHCPPHYIRYNNLLITHGHQDHLLSISRYVGLRNMNQLPPANIFIPEEQLENVQELLELWSKIEKRKNYNVNLIPVKPESTHELSKRYYFKSIKTQHSFDSLGYIIYEKRKKLKKEYLGLPGPELVKLKEDGIEIDFTLHIPQVGYSGDTTKDIFENPLIQECRYLILESTFLADEHFDISEDRAHLHLEDILEYIQTARNEYIILTHFSMRYIKRDAIEIIKEATGELYGEKVFVL